MKIVAGTYNIHKTEEYGAKFKNFTIAMAVEDGAYEAVIVTTIKLQWYEADKHYFAPKIETSLGLDNFGDSRREFAELSLIKRFKAFYKKSEQTAWDLNARMQPDMALHVDRFLQKCKFQHHNTWAEALDKIRVDSDKRNEKARP